MRGIEDQRHGQVSWILVGEWRPQCSSPRWPFPSTPWRPWSRTARSP